MLELTGDLEHPISIPCDNITLEGLLHIPPKTVGIVIFAHGSGSSRFSPRNLHIARDLQQQHFATILFDLLTPEEEKIDAETSQYRFDIALLSKRLIAATYWLEKNPILNKLPIGYFGASTGAGAALVAAARLADKIKAVVSRGGRPDLAGESLYYVKAPTLLIVGELDETVIALNQQAMASLHCTTQLEIIPGATHLFEEPGTLQAVSMFAQEWFKRNATS